MGIIYSLIAIPTALIKKSRDKKKANKVKRAEEATPPPYSPSQETAVAGLPIVGQQREEGLARIGEVPLRE
jgi:hypothetical protein